MRETLESRERTKREAEGFDFHGFPSAASRTAYRLAFGLPAEFLDVEEVVHSFTIYFLGVRLLRGKAAAHAEMLAKEKWYAEVTMKDGLIHRVK